MKNFGKLLQAKSEEIKEEIEEMKNVPLNCLSEEEHYCLDDIAKEEEAEMAKADLDEARLKESKYDI